MRKLKTRVIFIVIILLLLVASFFGGTIYNSPSKDNTTINSDLLATKISEVSEYTSLEYRYTNMGKFENQKDFYGWKVPLTTKRFIFTYDGIVKMGIEGKDLSLTVDENTVTVFIPPAKILSHEIKEDSIDVYDQTKNIFNPISIEDISGFTADQKTEMEEKILANALLEEAKDKAQEQLRIFIETILGPGEDYEIIFKH